MSYEEQTGTLARSLVDQGNELAEAPQVAVDEDWQIALG